MDFYDIEPRAGSHYLLKNGQAIARFDELARAEEVRTGRVAAVAKRFERGPGWGGSSEASASEWTAPRSEGCIEEVFRS
jgi:hypothetical protein